MKSILETDRLVLSELTRDDSAFIIRLANSPGWLTFIGDRNIRSIRQAEDYLSEGPIKCYSENGYGLWQVQKKEDGMPLGICGLLNRKQLDHPDLGFAFLPEHEGCGYASESASATLVYAHDQLQLPAVDAITRPDNERAIRLLEKLKFVRREEEIFLQPDESLLLFRHNKTKG